MEMLRKEREPDPVRYTSWIDNHYPEDDGRSIVLALYPEYLTIMTKAWPLATIKEVKR